MLVVFPTQTFWISSLVLFLLLFYAILDILTVLFIIHHLIVLFKCNHYSNPCGLTQSQMPQSVYYRNGIAHSRRFHNSHPPNNFPCILHFTEKNGVSINCSYAKNC